LKYPLVLVQDSSKTGAGLQILLTADDLAGVSKDHAGFVTLLSERAQQKGIRLEKC
jgi:hypothetical protein